MKASQVLFVGFVLLCLVFVASSWQLGLRGCVECGRNPRDGSTCEWVECRRPGAGNRLFQMSCRLPNGQTYGCVYRGNPHSCGNLYNGGNQARYYNYLANKNAFTRADGCHFWKLYHDGCRHAVFEKTNPTSGKKSPAPMWCDEFP